MDRREFLRESAMGAGVGAAISLSQPARAENREANQQRFRVGIIGRTGNGDYGHGLDLVWKGIPQVEVVAVADDGPGALARAVDRTGAQRGYADYRKMLEQERLDIVSVSPRWIDRHHEMVLHCAEHGCHIYMEKPFCRTMREADEIVQACEKKNLKLAIAHTNRYRPELKVVRKLIADGELGTILEFRARGKEDRRGGGEDLWVLGTHVLDLMQTLGGAVRSCYATVALQGRPVGKADVYAGNEGIGPLAGDSIDAMYQFKNGVKGYFASHRNQRGTPSRFALTVYGSRGAIEFPSGPPVHILQDPAWSPGRSGGKWVRITSGGIGKPEAAATPQGNQAAVLDLIAAIEEDRQPINSMYDARAATEMIVAVFDSHRVGGPVSLPLKNRDNPLTML